MVLSSNDLLILREGALLEAAVIIDVLVDRYWLHIVSHYHSREARVKGVMLRWWQPRHGGAGHDQWALDHVEVVLWVPNSQPAQGTEKSLDRPSSLPLTPPPNHRDTAYTHTHILWAHVCCSLTSSTISSRRWCQASRVDTWLQCALLWRVVCGWLLCVRQINSLCQVIICSVSRRTHASLIRTTCSECMLFVIEMSKNFRVWHIWNFKRS